MEKDTYIQPKKFLNKNPSVITSMQCTWGLLMFLDRKAVRHESWEDVIWRLIASKQLTKEDRKTFKERGFEKFL